MCVLRISVWESGLLYSGYGYIWIVGISVTVWREELDGAFNFVWFGCFAENSN